MPPPGAWYVLVTAGLEHPVAIDRLVSALAAGLAHAATATSALMQRTFTSPNVCDRRDGVVQRCLGQRAPRGERAAGRQVGAAAVAGRGSPAAGSAARRGRSRRRAAPACTDAAAPPSPSSIGPDSTTRPAYITARSWHTSRATARSWVTNSRARSRSRRSSSSRRRMATCVVTSSAVVGSSAISSRGSLAERDGDGDALAHAAGELVRVALQPVPGVEHAEPLEQGDDRVVGLLARRLRRGPRRSACGR